MNHSNMNPNDDDGSGTISRPAHIDYARAPTTNYTPAALNIPPAYVEGAIPRPVDRTIGEITEGNVSSRAPNNLHYCRRRRL
jgi:hypothetical protein